MSSLLSAISGKFSTNLVLGTFFPVTVFVFLTRVLWVPLLPAGFHPALAVPLAGLDDKWELLVLTLVTVVLSGLLYNLNIPLIRFYEGYPWKDSWIGRWSTDRNRAVLQALVAQKGGTDRLAMELKAEAKALEATADDLQARQLAALANAAEKGLSAVLRQLFLEFPLRETSILPTELGNRIRSFESYPERQYGMSAIALWPRLISVIEAPYAEAIDAAKTGLDFMLNSATLSGLLAFLLLATGLVYPTPFAASGSAAAWIAEIAFLNILAVWFYRQSLGRASAWGDLVRGAFDLYRGKLLEKLGYTQQPKTAEAERALWWAITSRLSGGPPPQGRGEVPPYSDEAISCRTDSGDRLIVARGVLPSHRGFGLDVVLEVRNPAGLGKSSAAGLVVLDTVPEGFELLWGSQTASEGTAEIEGTNPFRFRLSEPLAPQARRLITYCIVPREAASR